MITPEEIKRLFELSRIEASREELEKFPKELDAIFSYIEKLKSAPPRLASSEARPLGDLPPTLSFVAETTEFRKDGAYPLDATDVEFLKNSFPEREGDYLKTKKVFEG